MFITVLLAIIFFFIGGYELLQGNYYVALSYEVCSFILFGMLIFFQKERKKRNDFIQWIENNRAQIRDRGLMNDKGYIIDKSTELVQYFACVSLAILTVKIPSRYYIKDTLSSNFARLIYILITILFGWWGLPHGPISTISVIYKNIKGSNKVVVSKLIEEDITVGLQK